MLTTTDAGDLAAAHAGGQGAQRDPLVHFCENEIVDSRSLAAEISRALALEHAAQEGELFWGRSPRCRAAPQARGAGAQPAAGAAAGETARQELPRRARPPPRSARRGRSSSPTSRPSPRSSCHRTSSARGAARTRAPSRTTPASSSRRTAARSFSTRSRTSISSCSASCWWCSSRRGHPAGRLQGAPAQPKLVAATNVDLEALVREGRFRRTSTCGSTGDAAARAAAARAQGRPAGAGALRLPRGAALGAAASAGARVACALPHSGRVRRGLVHGVVRQACSAGRGPQRLRALRQQRVARAAAGARVAGQPPRAAAARHQRARLRARGAARFGRAAETRQPGRSERAPAVLAISDALVDQLLGPPVAQPAGPVRSAPARGPAAGGERRVEVVLKPARPSPTSPPTSSAST